MALVALIAFGAGVTGAWGQPRPAQAPSPTPPPPGAPAPGSPADPQVAEARARFAAGVQKWEAGDYTGALAEFERAFALRPHPAVRINVANCLLRLGRAADAVDAFELYLRESPDLPAEQRSEIERSIAEARRNFAEVHVRVNVSGALVTVDGDRIGTSPLEKALRLRPGNHLVDVRRAGYTAYTQRIDFFGGAPRDLRVDLVEHPGIGVLVVESAPVGARVRIDGRQAGATPLESELESGSHRVQVERGPVFWTSEIHVGEANTTRVRVDLPAEVERRSSTPLWVGGTIAAATFALGVGLGVYAIDHNARFEATVRQIESLPPSDSSLPALQARGEQIASETRLAAVSADLSFLGALLSAGITAYFYWKAPLERIEPRADVRVSLAPSGRGAALGVSGRF